MSAYPYGAHDSRRASAQAQGKTTLSSIGPVARCQSLVRSGAVHRGQTGCLAQDNAMGGPAIQRRGCWPAIELLERHSHTRLLQTAGGAVLAASDDGAAAESSPCSVQGDRDGLAEEYLSGDRSMTGRQADKQAGREWSARSGG